MVVNVAILARVKQIIDFLRFLW